MKQSSFLKIFFSLFVFLGSFAQINTSWAQELKYTFIERLPILGPILTSSQPGKFFVQYVGSMYLIILGGAAILALFMLVLGGVQYTYVALSPSAKNDAKSRMFNAVIGLLVVLGAYVLLNTINPDFVRLDLTIEQIKSSGGGGSGTVTTNPLPGSSVIGTPGISVPWTAEQEAATRAKLKAGGVTVNHTNSCGGTGGGQGCTDVAGLTDETVNQVVAFNQVCGCNVMISGGTEPGHQTHTNGQFAYKSVDISKGGSGSGLDAFIKTNGTKTTCPVNSGWTAYNVSGGIYCNEDSEHWHVIYP